MLASASSDLGQLRFGDSYFYLKHQLLYGLSVGLIGFFLASKFYYRNYQNIAVILFILSILMLTLIFTPLGITRGGATRWLGIGPVQFQPSELLKITFIVYLASWLGAVFNYYRPDWDTSDITAVNQYRRDIDFNRPDYLFFQRSEIILYFQRYFIGDFRVPDNFLSFSLPLGKNYEFR